MSTSTLTRRRLPSSAANITETISENIKSAMTVSWNEIPEWMKDNEYIVTGYRRAQNSWSDVLRSLFLYLHNESVNVHSHLWPAFLFLLLLATTYSTHISQYSTATWIDGTGFVIFLGAAVFCLTCSAIYHMSIGHSEEAADFCGTLDYCGIIILIVGSFFPCIYYGFFCHTLYQVLYLTGITVAGAGAAYVVLAPKFATPEYRSARASVFSALGLVGFLPLCHAVISHGFRPVWDDMGYKWLVLSGALYLTGAIIYANRVPERWFPGKFDYFFASHQIFHVHVVLAAFAHYACVLNAFHHWHGVRGGVCLV